MLTELLVTKTFRDHSKST